MASLLVEIPQARTAEHEWIVNTILDNYLGIETDIRSTTDRFITITATSGETQKHLRLPSILLTGNPDDWQVSSVIPDTIPLWIEPQELPWDVPQITSAIPMLYVGNTGNASVSHENGIDLRWDIFGSAFFMLSRLEETLVAERDAHGRFPAATSLAVKHGFERIPVVNAWAEMLWSAIHTLWPTLQRRTHQYQPVVSHDVDWPLASQNLALPLLIRACAGDVIVRKSPPTAVRRFLGNLIPGNTGEKINPGNTFDFIMTQSESRNIKSAFFFIPENTAGEIDGTYSLDMPFIQRLMREIHDRGHEIGIHPGYESYLSADRIASGFDRLKAAADACGIAQAEWGGRQHYLRWSAPETWRHWNSAGLSYDSSVGYAELVGFRTGACFDYQVFDVENRETLSLIERPLIVMEASMFATTTTTNMMLPDDQGVDILTQLAASTRSYGGNFTLLWHNSALITPRQKRLYERSLDAIS